MGKMSKTETHSLTVHVLSQLLVILLLCVQLEVHNVALILGDGLVIADVNLFGALTAEYVVHVREIEESKTAPQGYEKTKTNTTYLIKRMSCEIIKTPPWNLLRQRAKASIDSMSSGFVGSSNKSK